MRLPTDAGIPGQVWQTKKPAWIPDVIDLPNFPRRERARAAGLHAALALPITLDGGQTVTAVLVLFSATPLAEDTRMVELFSAVAAQLGLAMQRKHAEQELRSSQGLLESVITNAPIIVFVTDKDGIVTLSEGQGLAGLGLKPGEFVGRSLFAIYGDMPEILSQRRRGLAGEAFTGFVDVANRFFQVWYSPRRGRNGEIVGLLGVAADITERRQLEEQLRRAQRLESVGLLAGGIAHDFNNMLTAITGYAELLLDELPVQDPMREDVAQISAVAQRAGLLTYQLLAFSRQQVLRPMPLNLHEAATDVIRMLRRVIGEDIEIVVNGGHDLAMVNADPGQIGQVIMNLAVNARDAMPSGGRLTIETANVELGPDFATNEPVVPGPYVMIAVSDTGTGMTADVLERVFEPFFTTKPIGKGTGMGLATVYGIVRQSGGHVVVESEAGKGSTFRIYIPIATETERVREPQGADTHLARGRETVLLVEDEDVVRRLVKRALETCGYTVLEASDGLHALALTEQEGVAIDMIITDVVMPNMSGRELVDRLAADRPGLRVLYISGYTADAMLHRGFAADSTPFIQKPFTMRALTQKVRSILDAPST
jgi:PAS domain S-box-containing protein